MTVVELATSCPLLLYACVALSARHLSNTVNSVPSEIAEDYHGRCIAILLPILANGEFRTRLDTLLAATVILRLYEQISCMCHGPLFLAPPMLSTNTTKQKARTPLNDSQSHLLAGAVYITSRLECAISGGLVEASFWAFVVQDIQFALAYQIPIRLPLNAVSKELYQRWRDHHHLTEQDWVHKAIFLLAKTVDHCYSLDSANHETQVIEREIQKWEAKRPDTFQPLYFHPADLIIGKPFPTVCYTSTGHGM